MPTQTQLPTGYSTHEWGSAGLGDPNCVKTNDGDTSYIYASNQNLVHLYAMDAFPAGVIDPVDACTTHLVIKTVGGDVGAYYSWDGDSWFNIGARGTSYAAAGATYYSLAKADITAGECGVKSPSTGTVTGRVTQVYRLVTFHLAVGSMAFLIGSLVGASVGLAQMAPLARAVAKRTRVLITPDEYMETWRELRDWRHPVYFLP
jgi:hypothetical protein